MKNATMIEKRDVKFIMKTYKWKSGLQKYGWYNRPKKIKVKPKQAPRLNYYKWSILYDRLQTNK